MLTRLFKTLTDRSPRLRKAIWRAAYDYLARSYRQDFWRFMNYGYAPLETGMTGLVLEDRDEADRYCIQLYHLVANAIDVSGLHVLEVGCGRGGGASYITRYLKPATMTGMDFSQAAITFCREQHHVPGLTFVEGDAEAMPFDAGRFDAVVNMESSHCYGNMDQFLAEVTRVLKPGGRFLFADLRGKNEVATLRHQLNTSNLAVVEESDITSGVIRALDLDNVRKETLIRQIVRGPVAKYFRDFAGIKNSGVYDRFRTGHNVYLRFVLVKK